MRRTLLADTADYVSAGKIRLVATHQATVGQNSMASSRLIKRFSIGVAFSAMLAVAFLLVNNSSDETGLVKSLRWGKTDPGSMASSIR